MSRFSDPRNDSRSLRPAPARHLLRLDSEWRNLKDSYAGLSEDEMLRLGPEGLWSIKDILDHVSIWEEESLHHLPLVTKGQRLPRYSAQGGIDAFNARAYAAHRHLSLAAIRSQMETTHSRLLAYLLATNIAQLTARERFLRRLGLDTYLHYRLHADSIRAWRASWAVVSPSLLARSSRRL